MNIIYNNILNQKSKRNIVKKTIISVVATTILSTNLLAEKIEYLGFKDKTIEQIACKRYNNIKKILLKSEYKLLKEDKKLIKAFFKDKQTLDSLGGQFNGTNVNQQTLEYPSNITWDYLAINYREFISYLIEEKSNDDIKLFILFKDQSTTKYNKYKPDTTQAKYINSIKNIMEKEKTWKSYTFGEKDFLIDFIKEYNIFENRKEQASYFLLHIINKDYDSAYEIIVSDSDTIILKDYADKRCGTNLSKEEIDKVNAL